MNGDVHFFTVSNRFQRIILYYNLNFIGKYYLGTPIALFYVIKLTF